MIAIFKREVVIIPNEGVWVDIPNINGIAVTGLRWILKKNHFE